MEKINVEELLAPRRPRENFNLFWVDGEYALRVAKVEGTFPWHHHPDSDEGWFVYKGRLTIQTEGVDVTLEEGEAAMVPRGLVHAPRADADGTIVMIVNGRGFETVFRDGDSLESVGFAEEDVAAG